MVFDGGNQLVVFKNSKHMTNGLLTQKQETKNMECSVLLLNQVTFVYYLIRVE